MKYTKLEYDILTEIVIQSAIDVHKELGSGLLESVYEICPIKVLQEEGLNVKSQILVPIVLETKC